MLPVMINDVPVSCINHVAIVYHVPASVILSVMKAENGKNGDAIKNKNGTIDYGVMQINSIWLPKISAYGYTKNDLQYNACKNVAVGAWLISRNMAEGKAVWRSIANYHSHTPVHNKIYRDSLYANYQTLVNIIS
jgi:soluble lytic murein transglycosylase-like protein